MGSFKVFDRQSRRLVAAVALLAATVMPAAVPALVSAATITNRSVALSSSAKAATNVSYNIDFTAESSTGAFIVDFCTTAAVGSECTVPTGLDVTTPDTDDSATVTKVGAGTGTVKVVLDSPVAADNPVSVELTGLTNPTNAGTVFARVVTYTNSTNADTYTDAESLGTSADEGAVALAITDNFSVGGSVLETLVFCASGTAFDTDGCTGAVTDPNVSLGEDGVLGNTVSDGTIYSQISTNAAHGAVVNLKSNAVGCGGLMLEGASGAAACNITPVKPAATIADDAAKFGLKIGTIDDGTGTIDLDYGYSTSNYFMNYVTGDETGVTSTYGDTIYDTHDAPVSKATVPLIFGANISNDTPAGNYSATLNLIATGKF